MLHLVGFLLTLKVKRVYSWEVRRVQDDSCVIIV